MIQVILHMRQKQGSSVWGTIMSLLIATGRPVVIRVGKEDRDFAKVVLIFEGAVQEEMPSKLLKT